MAASTPQVGRKRRRVPTIGTYATVLGYKHNKFAPERLRLGSPISMDVAAAGQDQATNSLGSSMRSSNCGQPRGGRYSKCLLL